MSRASLASDGTLIIHAGVVTIRMHPAKRRADGTMAPPWQEMTLNVEHTHDAGPARLHRAHARGPRKPKTGPLPRLATLPGLHDASKNEDEDLDSDRLEDLDTSN